MTPDRAASPARTGGMALRGLASVGLLALALWLVDPAAVAGRLAGVPVWAVGVAVGLHVVIVGLMGWRWHGVVRLHNRDFGLGRATAVTFVGALFNQVLPTSMGGDVARAWLARGGSLSTADAVSSVVVDRIVGSVGLVVFVAAMTLVAGARLGAPLVVAFLLALVPVGAAGCFVLSLGRLPGLLGRWRARLGGDRLARDLGAVWARRGLAVWLLGLSMVGQVLAAGIGYAVVVGTGIGLSFVDCLLIFPAMVLATMVPISFAGWGVREGAAVFLLGLVGVGPAVAVAVSIVFGATQAIAALPGAVVWAGAGRAVAKGVAWPS